MSKSALITGITGQDGSYLAELLLSKGYEVHGVIRRSSNFNTQRIDPIYDKLVLHYGDLSDGRSLRGILGKCKPSEVYNLGAQSHVKVSFEQPEYTADIVATGTLRLLNAIRDYQEETGHEVKMYQASSSEMFGGRECPINEKTALNPKSPYAISKVAAHFHAKNYRESYGMKIWNGILFNHESPRRGETFVTRKITRAVGRIKAGLQGSVHLGNLEAKRDWGFAGDYVRAMYLMLQTDVPDDYVIATGQCWTVQEFAEAAFSVLDLNWRDHVRVDPKYFRPIEVDQLIGDASKAAKGLDWYPSVSFYELVEMMVLSDYELAKKEAILR